MNKEASTVTPDPGFVVIKYGDDQEAILNPLCSSYIFLDWIKRICNCDNDSTLDLVDLEGHIRNLPVTNDDYASDYVTGRETYIVIRVERQGDHGPHRYTSLLNNLEQVNPELLVKLNNLSRPNTRSSNKKDKLRRAAIRTPRAATNGAKGDNRQRPSSSSRSRQGK
ncbi:hypothetical protein RRG08_045604 [Elysia crispata]|uniref:Uncharacterized protein n=1 Tax=Elysia crispata TaxID=231223 RepID=A0AAE1AE38_9GAST|nr:hypothetical protein RRG08_045604 [Elysia crispata]